MSPREEIQWEIRDTLFCLGLDDAYGITDGKRNDQKGKSFRFLTFCRARITDGEVRIYSPKFIMVKWQTANRTMPHRGQEIFRSPRDVKLFLQRNFA